MFRLWKRMPAADRPTTITIRTGTRHRLESMKRPAETYDDLILEFAEEYCPRMSSPSSRDGLRKSVPVP